VCRYAAVSCASAELRYLAAADDLWRPLYDAEFRGAGGGGGGGGGAGGGNPGGAASSSLAVAAGVAGSALSELERQLCAMADDVARFKATLVRVALTPGCQNYMDIIRLVINGFFTAKIT
jgi:hypothetical protein